MFSYILDIIRKIRTVAVIKNGCAAGSHGGGKTLRNERAFKLQIKQLDTVPCGCKRRAEESPYMNLLDIGPCKHSQGEAIVNLDSSIDPKAVLAA